MKTTIIAAITVLVTACLGSHAIAKDEAPKLDGKWVAVGFSADGMEIPAATLKSIPWYWTVEGNRIQSRRPGSGGKYHYDEKLAFTIDPSTKPMAFDMTDTEKKETFKCICKVEGDQITICLTADKNGPRPKDFSAAKGSKQVLIVWKRVKE